MKRVSCGRALDRGRAQGAGRRARDAGRGWAVALPGRRHGQQAGRRPADPLSLGSPFSRRTPRGPRRSAAPRLRAPGPCSHSGAAAWLRPPCLSLSLPLPRPGARRGGPPGPPLRLAGSRCSQYAMPQPESTNPTQPNPPPGHRATPRQKKRRKGGRGEATPAIHGKPRQAGPKRGPKKYAARAGGSGWERLSGTAKPRSGRPASKYKVGRRNPRMQRGRTSRPRLGATMEPLKKIIQILKN